MAKLALAHTFICIGAVSFAALALSASAPDDEGMISFRPNGALATRRSVALRIDPDPARLTTIFSNFGKRHHLYEDHVAWDVAGPNSGVQEQWVAMPFTPIFDAEVTQISIAVEHNTGSPNSFVVSLNEDNGGQIPGRSIYSWIVRNAPKFGTCCLLDVVKDATGLHVNKGTQYWVVAKTNASEKATRMEWDLSPRAIEGNFAFNNGQGWYEYTAFTSAFAVYGRKRYPRIQGRR
jgi:hypothetical protein